MYDIAEEYWTKAIELSISDLHTTIASLNRGKSRLEMNKLQGALQDSLISANSPIPDISGRAHINLGKIYFKQGLNSQSRESLVSAIKLTPAVPEAYYNLGVLALNEGEKEQARKLFQTALSINTKYREARYAIDQLDKVRAKREDWLAWWSQSNFRRGLAFVIIMCIGAVTVRTLLDSLYAREIPVSTFGTAGLLVILLLLPFVQKLKAGPIELEMRSVDKELSVSVVLAMSAA